MRGAPRASPGIGQRAQESFLRGGACVVSSRGGAGAHELSSDNHDFQENAHRARPSVAERVRRVPRPVRVVALVSIGAVLVSAACAVGLWAEGAAARAGALGRELDRTRLSIVTLERSNELLRSEIAGLREEPRVIERAAREVLGLVRDGELVVFLETDTGDGADAAPAGDGARPAPPGSGAARGRDAAPPARGPR